MSQATNVAAARPLHQWPEETPKNPRALHLFLIKDIIATADEWQNTKDSFRQQACPPKLYEYINTNERRVNFEKSCCRSVSYNEEVSTCLFKVYCEK